MIVLLNYRMYDVSKKYETLRAFFESIDKDVELLDGTLYAAGKEENFVIDEAVETVYLNKALEDCRKLKDILADDFILEGTIDTSDAAGEYMDFKITVSGDRISLQSSDWYCETCMESYADYADFCECFFECSEEEYEKIKNCEFVYLLETQTPEGDVLATSVPLYDVEL